jgi:hypothetical protein
MSGASFNLGSARFPRAGERVLAIANFPWTLSPLFATQNPKKVRLGATPKPARVTRYPEARIHE